MKYILNSAVITTQGIYEYQLIFPGEAKQWLQEGNWESTIGYEETAIALKQITNVEIPMNRKQIKMEKGDEALVFRLTKRLAAPELKGEIGLQTILENCEIGILRKLQ